MPKSTLPSTKRKAPTRKAPTQKAPWKEPAPKRSRHTKLTSKEKSKPRRAAKRAGRPYPNLVDNMRVAAAKRGPRRAKSAKRPAPKQTRS
jgi:hypothetical protein